MNKWKTIPDTVFVSSASRTRDFGSNITFNNTGTLLAIGGLFSQVYDEQAIFTGGNTSPVGGAVFIYKKDDSGAWVNRPSAVLASNSPTDYAYFGRSFVFSPTENKLFVGEPQGLVNQRSYGSVNIYDSSLF